VNLALRKPLYHLRGAIASPRARRPVLEPDPGTLADLQDLLARLSLTDRLVPTTASRT